MSAYRHPVCGKGTPPQRPALARQRGVQLHISPMRSRLLFPRSFGRGRGSVSRIDYIARGRYWAAMRIKRLPARFVILPSRS
jgi:hypothetical protein